MDSVDPMDKASSSTESGFYRVTRGFRWFAVVAVPPLVALVGWAAIEMVRDRAPEGAATQLLALAFMLTLFGGVALSLVSAVVWAFRAHVRIDAETMTVQGAYRKVVIQADLLDGFRIINGQFHVYLENRYSPIQIAYFENIRAIEHWVRQRTRNIDEDFLDDEAVAIRNDVSLGFHADEQSMQLATLRKWVTRANYLIYAAIAVAAANFFILEDLRAEQISATVLVLVPLLLNVIALSHRGHIQVDFDEGTRYPQISTATFASGIALMLLALLDRGALLSQELYAFTALGVAINGLWWSFIDQKRLSILWERGKVAMLMTVVSFFLIPAAWVGGSLYHVNKLADVSASVWYETSVVEKTKMSGKGPSYSIDLAPWLEGADELVRVTVRRAEFNRFQSGMATRVAVRDGALGVPWVADVVPGTRVE